MTGKLALDSHLQHLTLGGYMSNGVSKEKWEVVHRGESYDADVSIRTVPNPNGSFEWIARVNGQGAVARCQLTLDRANLIAAAPELLEALESLMDAYTAITSDNPEADTDCEAAIKAITKAKGLSK